MSVIAIIELFLTGALAGLAAGFMGVGGGAVLTPLCLVVYPAVGIASDNLVKVIFGTNMFLITAFSLSAALKHHSNRKVDWRSVAVMGPLAIVGSVFGGWLASHSDSSTLIKSFAILLAISSVLIVLKGSTNPAGKNEGTKPLLPVLLLPLVGFIGGAFGSFLGIGGGAIMIPILILAFSFPVDRIAGTTSSIFIFIGLFGMLSYMWYGRGMTDLPGWSTGYVWWSGAIPVALGGVPMAQVGAWINSKTHAMLLQRLFGLFLLVIALKILFF